MLRPVNLRTDLAPLADLIELVFADSMDASGRAALREMRSISRMGVALPLMAKLNEMTAGIGMGVVWVEGGLLVGNVSIYPARLPKDAGRVWIIANVGVHPAFQRRGIARRLMQAALKAIRARKGDTAVLQVDADNWPAQSLYEKLGFVTERTFTTYKRQPSLRLPMMHTDAGFYLRRRRQGEWKAEMALAQRLRPPERGGIGWLKPLLPAFFRRGLLTTIDDWLSFRHIDRFVTVSPQGQLLGSMWVERTFGVSTRLFLMPDFERQPAAEAHADALLATAIRQYGSGVLLLEHPQDEAAIGPILDRFRFLPQRSVTHMRWTAP